MKRFIYEYGSHIVEELANLKQEVQIEMEACIKEAEMDMEKGRSSNQNFGKTRKSDENFDDNM